MITKHPTAPVRTTLALLSLAVLVGCGRPGDPINTSKQDLHEAVAQGNLETVQRHIASGADLDQKDPMGGSSPLITAAVFGRPEVVRVLIEAGADVDFKNNEGSTPLICAAFFGHADIVEMLLANSADKTIRNNSGSTALDSVAGPFAEVKGIYDLMGATLGLQLDYDRIKATRPQIAAMLR